MVKISATIITYNEEKNIERCIQSLVSIADEIIVVDSDSTDKTVEICNTLKVKVYNNAFDGFSQQKRFAIEKASNDIILSLDADEALSVKLRNSILKVKGNWLSDAYYFKRKTNFCGKWINHSGWYPDPQLRIWDRKKGNWNENKIHEKVEMQSGSKIGKLEGDLEHYSFYNFTQYLAQINKFTDYRVEEYQRKNKKPTIFRMIFKPFGRFVTSYLFKLGFLDGYRGFVIAISSAYSLFITYVKLRHRLEKK